MATPAETLEQAAERIYNTDVRWRNCDHFSWQDAPPRWRKLAFQKARAAS